MLTEKCDIRNRLVTPAFLEARRRKHTNEISQGRVFPRLHSGVSKRTSVNKDGSNTCSAFPSTKIKHDVRNDVCTKEDNPGSNSSASCKSTDTAFYSKRKDGEDYEYESRLRLPMSNSSSLRRKKSLSLPSLSKTAPVNNKEDISRRSCYRNSTNYVLTDATNSKRKEQIKEWFSAASEKEKRIALNLLGCISPNLSVDHHDNITTFSRKRSQTSPAMVFPLQFGGHKKTSEMANISSITYNALQSLPTEFIIHPEWHEPPSFDKMADTKKMLFRTDAVAEPKYGYWMK